ncbi:MAG: DUF3995 domain-containing protein [Pseudomonadota bacterium]
METLAVLLAAVLVGIAGLHLAWGCGLRWPGEDERTLIDAVIGRPDVHRMPGLGLCLVVTLALLAAAFWALWAAGWVAVPDGSVVGLSVREIGLWLLVAVFLGRGAATYLPGPLSGAVEPFRTLDRRLYAPLCLALGVGFLVLLSVGLSVEIDSAP